MKLQLERVGKCALDHCFLRHGRSERMRGAEIVPPGNIENVRSQGWGLTFEKADISRPIEEVARFATLHLPPFDPVFVNYMLQNRLSDRDATVVRLTLKDFDVSGRRRGLNSRAVTHAAKERLVC